MKLLGKVESVSFIEHITESLDFCSITIDFDELKIFGVYNEILELVGNQVEYIIRQDMYKGQVIQIVANIAFIHTVQTLDKEEDIKLIPSGIDERQVCNFAIDSMRYGDYDVNCIAFLSSVEVGSSSKCKWVDCSMVDKKSKMFNVRIFTQRISGENDPVDVIKSFVGSYVKFNINYTKYGYQTNTLEYVNVPVVVPAEVEIAVTLIRETVANDSELQSYMEQFNYIQTLSQIIDGEFGYHLVSVAAELYVIKAISNITSEYDVRTLIRAAICSRGYLLPAKTKFSRPMLNTNKVLKSALSKDRDLILILDLFSEEEASPTKKIYIKISNFVKEIMNERRGIADEEDIDVSNINTVRNRFGGLL